MEISSENRYFKSIEGVLFNKDGKEMIRYQSGKNETTYIVQEYVKYIGNSSFSSCESLSSITLQNDVKSIDSSVWCYKLVVICLNYRFIDIKAEMIDGMLQFLKF